MGLSQTATAFKTYAEDDANQPRQAVFTYDNSQTPYELLSIHVQPEPTEAVSFFMIKAASKHNTGDTVLTKYDLKFTKENNNKIVSIEETSKNFSGSTAGAFYDAKSSDQSGADNTMRLEKVDLTTDDNDKQRFDAIKAISNTNDVYVMLLLTWTLSTSTSFQRQGIYVFEKPEYIDKFRIFQESF